VNLGLILAVDLREHCIWSVRNGYNMETVGILVILSYSSVAGRSRLPRDLRRVSASPCLLELRFLFPPETWMSHSCECCVLSGRVPCDGPIPRPEESYRS
jgi:hypothetical protein